jgi:non-haem Fe2+, alpha-ketoglutarate-dependent halogenase
MTTVSVQQAELYKRDGVLHPVPILSTEEVAAYQATLENLERALDDPKRLPQVHLTFRWAWDLAVHPAVLDTVESVLGPDLLIHSTMILTKPAGNPGVVTWHQDGTSSGIHLTPNTTAWIALWDSTAENGCLRVVPGSHRNTILPHVTSSAENHLLRSSPEVTVEVDEATATDVVLRAGEMSLHHSNIIHSSKANSSAKRRTGFIVRFVTSAAENLDWPVVRARGNGDCSHLEVITEPPPADSPVVPDTHPARS